MKHSTLWKTIKLDVKLQLVKWVSDDCLCLSFHFEHFLVSFEESVM